MSLIWPTATIVVGATFWVLHTRLRWGRVIGPMSMSIILLVAIFGFRPWFMINSQSFYFYGLDATSGFDEAAALGFIGLVSSIVAFTAFVRRTASAQQDRVHEEVVERVVPIRLALIVCVALLACWVAVMASVGGGLQFVGVLFGGRTDSVRDTLQGMPIVFSALPTGAAITMAIARVRLERHRKLTAFEIVMYWAAIGVAVVPPSALGDRRYIIPSILVALLAAARGRWNRRVSVKQILLGSFALSILMSIPYVRSAGSRAGGESFASAVANYLGTEGLWGSVVAFFTGYDTEMFSYVAYIAPRLDASKEFGWGRGTLGDLLLSPFPSALAPNPLWSDTVLSGIFGGSCIRSSCPVPSIVGVGYYDFAIPGVIILCAIFGVLAARFQKIYESGLPLSLLMLTFGGFAPVLTRGNTINLVWVAANCMLVAWIGINSTRLMERVFPTASLDRPVDSSPKSRSHNPATSK